MSTTTETVTTTLSSDPEYVPRGDVQAKLAFFQDPADGSKPYNYVNAPTDGRAQRNFSDNFVEVTVHDARGQESAFNLDDDAFQLLQNCPPSAETEFLDDEHIKKVYYPEVEKLLLDNVPGAHKVTLFDHTIRRSGAAAKRNPVIKVHVDQTPRSTEWRVKLHDPKEADELLKGRYRIINVWRPLNGPVQASPLAFASGRTTQDSDLVPVEHRYPHRTGETSGVRYNPDQKFYFFSGVTNDERILLKCFDNQESAATGAPHTAFVEPRTPEGGRPRESIEVRALVYG